jgi:hypothetical protein
LYTAIPDPSFSLQSLRYRPSVFFHSNTTNHLNDIASIRVLISKNSRKGPNVNIRPSESYHITRPSSRSRDFKVIVHPSCYQNLSLM